MKIIMTTDRYGGVVFAIKQQRPVKTVKDMERVIRRHGPYGPEWVLVKAISKKFVFRKSRERSVATYQIKD